MRMSYAWRTVTVVAIVYVLCVSRGEAQRVDPDHTVLAEELTVSSTNPWPVEITSLQPGHRYLIEATGTYLFSGVPDAIGDAAYGTYDGWATLSPFLGIHPTTVIPGAPTLTPGIISLLVAFDPVSDPSVAEWGRYRSDHDYLYEFDAASSTLRFVISDWWGVEGVANNIYMGDNAGALTVRIFEVLPVETVVVSSTNPAPVHTTAPLKAGHRYVVEAQGTYLFSGVSDAIGDAAYGTYDGWATLSPFLGIDPTSPILGSTLTPGVISLLVDSGDGNGPQVAQWGEYRDDHHYRLEVIPSSTALGFVISDWWGVDGVPNNAYMGDNSGALTVNVYERY